MKKKFSSKENKCGHRKPSVLQRGVTLQGNSESDNSLVLLKLCYCILYEDITKAIDRKLWMYSKQKGTGAQPSKLNNYTMFGTQKIGNSGTTTTTTGVCHEGLSGR